MTIRTTTRELIGIKKRTKALAAGLLMAGMMAASLAPAPAAHASTTFTVNAAFVDDPSDINLNDSMCDVSPDPGSQCTLRAAIEQANATAGSDTIKFNFLTNGGVATVSPKTALPNITDTVTIDGYSQPGAQPNTQSVGNDAVLKVQLSGTNLGSGATDGLVLQSGNNVVRGLVINRFGSDGIEIRGSGSKIEGNFIGTDPSGTQDLGNGASGVNIRGSNNDTVGNGSPGGSNIIAFNGGKGVGIEELPGASATGNRVLSNSIFSNDFLGIDLNEDNLTPNDTGDEDVGPNGFQNFPAISSAKNGTTTTIMGKLNSNPNKTYKVQFFSNPSGTDEGKVFVGQKSVTTDASGNASFTFKTAQKVAKGKTITTTATDPAGNTSEFSAPKTVGLATGSDLTPETLKVRGTSGLTKSPTAHFKFDSPTKRPPSSAASTEGRSILAHPRRTSTASRRACTPFWSGP
jgi:hypothetical protein